MVVVIRNRLGAKAFDQGYSVRVIDTQWFGNFLQPHEKLEVINGSVIDIETSVLDGVDAVVHLASIANDPCGDLNPKLTWETSGLATMQLADKCARSGVKQFIYASSGSVYGLKEEQQVTEDLELVPLSEYNKTKMVAERVVKSYENRMSVQIVRPATVCGFSKRMRLDVAVNLLTMQALRCGEITVLGGHQTRPNIHIDDITDLYVEMLAAPEKFDGVYNAGFENISILDIANMIVSKIDARVTIKPSNDPRSYRVNSDRLLATGFSPKKNVDTAIEELIAKYRVGELVDEPRYYNLAWMADLGVANPTET